MTGRWPRSDLARQLLSFLPPPAGCSCRRLPGVVLNDRALSHSVSTCITSQRLPFPQPLHFVGDKLQNHAGSTAASGAATQGPAGCFEAAYPVSKRGACWRDSQRAGGILRVSQKRVQGPGNEAQECSPALCGSACVCWPHHVSLAGTAEPPRGVDAKSQQSYGIEGHP